MKFASKRGLSYPIQIEDGGLKLSEDLDLIREAIYSVLETRWFERAMRPGYGTPDYIFTAVQNENLIAEQIRQALETQILGVDEWRVEGNAYDNGVLELSINYSISRIPQPPIKYQLNYD